MKRKFLNIESVLCAALVAGIATGCSASRKAQRAAEKAETVEEAPAVADSAETVKPSRDVEPRMRVLYGVPNMDYRKLDR